MLEGAQLQHNEGGKLLGGPVHSPLPVPPDHPHGQLRVLLHQIVRERGVIPSSIMTGNPLVLPIYRLSREEWDVCFRKSEKARMVGEMIEEGCHCVMESTSRSITGSFGFHPLLQSCVDHGETHQSKQHNLLYYLNQPFLEVMEGA